MWANNRLIVMRKYGRPDRGFEYERMDSHMYVAAWVAGLAVKENDVTVSVEWIHAPNERHCCPTSQRFFES
jgi:hypothetical protein